MAVDINVYLDKSPQNLEAWLLEQGFQKKQYDSGISYVKNGVEVTFSIEDIKLNDDVKKALGRNKTEFPENVAATIYIITSADRSEETVELQEQLPFTIKEKFGGVIYDPQSGEELR